MIGRRFQIVFFIFAALEIASQIFQLNLSWVTKPMLVISLAIYYFQSVPSINKRFFIALVFCWIGDVLLMFDHVNELFFMAGLGAFLIAHLFLIFSYRQLSSPNDDEFKGTQRVRLSFPIILAGSGLVVILYPKLGELKIPVVIYAFVLALMVVQSILRLGRTNARSFWLVFLGAGFFMLSDSLLAINKFYQSILFAGVWVMATYIVAIYLIVKGVIAHSEKAS
jgi:uncharacterized membrane protein YhhN